MKLELVVLFMKILTILSQTKWLAMLVFSVWSYSIYRNCTRSEQCLTVSSAVHLQEIRHVFLSFSSLCTGQSQRWNSLKMARSSSLLPMVCVCVYVQKCCVLILAKFWTKRSFVSHIFGGKERMILKLQLYICPPLLYVAWVSLNPSPETRLGNEVAVYATWAVDLDKIWHLL